MGMAVFNKTVCTQPNWFLHSSKKLASFFFSHIAGNLYTPSCIVKKSLLTCASHPTGIVLTVKTQAERQLMRECKLREKLMQDLLRNRDYCNALEQEISSLRELLQSHGITELPPTVVVQESPTNIEENQASDVQEWNSRNIAARNSALPTRKLSSCARMCSSRTTGEAMYVCMSCRDCYEKCRDCVTTCILHLSALNNTWEKPECI